MINKRWGSVGLSKKQICFLDDISKDCKFSGGHKLRRTAILRAFLIAGKKLNINVNNIKSEKSLRERMITAFKKGVGYGKPER